MPTLEDLLRQARETLRAGQIDQAGREAALLLGHLLGAPQSALLARDREEAHPETARRFSELIARRAAGEPVAYLTGQREFYGRSFAVDRRVLIPRPETEHLVEIALSLPLPERSRVLDVGTGSGCIAVTLAAERPAWRVVAGDVSIGALAVAATNARRHGVAEGLELVAADLVAGLDLSSFDLVVGNPPYVEAGVVPFLSRDVRDFEPRVALVGGEDGTATTDRLLRQLAGLRAGAFVALEFGLGQEDAVAAIAERHGAFDLVVIRRDLAGIERDVVFVRRP